MIGIGSADDDFDYVLRRRVAHGGSAERFELVAVKKFKFILPQAQLRERRRTSSLFDRGIRFERNRLFEKNSEFFICLKTIKYFFVNNILSILFVSAALFSNQQNAYLPNPSQTTPSASVEIEVNSDEEFNRIANQRILNCLGKKKWIGSVEHGHEPLWTLDTEFCQECQHQDESTLVRPSARATPMPSCPPTTQPPVPIR